MFISVESIIDIITNSSTEIYTFPSDHAGDLLKKIINQILKEAGTDKTFDDLFEIEKVPNDYVEDEFKDWVSYECKEDFPGLKPVQIIEMLEKDPLLRQKYFPLFKESRDFEYNCRYKDGIQINRKDGSDTGLANMVEKVFQSEEVEN